MAPTAGSASAATEKPPHQRPEHPDFWCKRFREGVTPWAADTPSPELLEFAHAAPHPLTTLIPGCGNAPDIGWLASAGWPVTGLDFSPEAIARARAALGHTSAHLTCGDFFTFTPQPRPQLIVECAFLCALPRKCWPDWGRRMAELLPPGGWLAGYFFVCDQPNGPPFGISETALASLLGPAFIQRENRPSCRTLPVFAGRERWQVWQKQADQTPRGPT